MSVGLRRLDLTLVECTCGSQRLLSTAKVEEYKQWHERVCDGTPKSVMRKTRAMGFRGVRKVVLEPQRPGVAAA